MVKELSELLHESVAATPEGSVQMDGVLAAGRRRVRRRRVVAVTGTAAVVAALAVGSSLAAGVGLGGANQAAPAGGTGPVGPVLRLDEARDAVAGEDFSVLTTLTNENLDEANGRYYTAVTPDGQILVQDGPHGIDNEIRWGLLDPRTEEIRWLVDPGGGTPAGRVIDTDERWLVWSQEVNDALGFTALDRESGEWRNISLDPSELDMPAKSMVSAWGSALGPDDRIYFSTTSVAGDGALEQFPLWSASLTGPPDLRREGTVGEFDVEGEQLTFTDYTNRPSSTVHVRDLGSGDESSFDARSGTACNLLHLERSGGNIVLFQYCGTHDGVRDDRVQVISSTGDPVVTVQDDNVELGTVTSRFVMLQGMFGAHAGSYAYDLDSGDFQRLSLGAGRFGTSMTGHDNLVTWSTPVNNGHGMKLWAAELD